MPDQNGNLTTADYNNTLQTLRNQGLQNVVNHGLSTIGNNPALYARATMSTNNLPQGSEQIIIDEKFKNELSFFQDTIDQQRDSRTVAELAFFMLGYKDENGNVIVEDVVYDKKDFENELRTAQANNSDVEAHISDNLLNVMNDYFYNSGHKSPVIIHGHTHPHDPNVSNHRLTTSPSLHDLATYTYLNDIFKSINPNAEAMGLIINEVGDFNTVSVNTQLGRLERNKVFLGNQRLPSYTEGHYLVDSQQSVRQAQQVQPVQPIRQPSQFEQTQATIQPKPIITQQPNTTITTRPIENIKTERPKRALHITDLLKQTFESVGKSIESFKNFLNSPLEFTPIIMPTARAISSFKPSRFIDIQRDFGEPQGASNINSSQQQTNSTYRINKYGEIERFSKPESEENEDDKTSLITTVSEDEINNVRKENPDLFQEEPEPEILPIEHKEQGPEIEHEQEQQQRI